MNELISASQDKAENLATSRFTQFRGGLRAVLRAALDVALPPLWPSYRAPLGDGAGLCAACWSKLSQIEPPYCARLGIPFAYDPGAGLLSMEAIANPPAYDRARAAGRELLGQSDALLPVPLHWRRLWARRFNQSAALARAISDIAGVPVLHGALKRVRATPQQVGLSKTERAENVQGAFRVPAEEKPQVAGRRLVLIDDVLTSGATVDTCARALLRAGAAHVDVLVFARVVAPVRTPI
jgi:predicted amidophosphoribosyltransferase